MTGIDKFRETAEKLKKDTEETKESEVKEAALAKSQLDIVRNDPALAKMYGDNARVGAENLGGVSPILKVINLGKSSVEIADGSDPKNGWFYYGPTGEQFKEVECHILSISRGYRTEPLQSKPDQKKQFNQLMSGLILNDGRNLPFTSYVTGSKLENMWAFGKEAAKYTRAKPIGIPLFALRVKLKNHSIPNPNGGLIWIIDFEIMKNEDGSPVIVTDMGEFQFLKDMVEQMEAIMDSIIEKKAIEEDEEVRTIKTIRVTESEPAEISKDKEEKVEADEIPF